MGDEEDLEILGEQLYSRLYPKHKETAGKLTGEVNSHCDTHMVKTIKMYFF